jgi:hypothetical protein
MSSKKFKISDDKLWYKIESEFSTNGGIYQLSCLDKNNQTIGINRIIKTDTNGIIYIGKASSFLDRVISLKKSISPDYSSESHDCGLRYKGSSSIKRKFPYENLIIELKVFKDIHKAEKELLSEYEIEFGELPPLNRSK